MKRKGSAKRRTRDKLKKHFRGKGKISITRYLQKFNDGDKVLLSIEPAVNKGTYHMRFYGRTGFVKRKNGSCYEIIIDDLGKKKCIIVHPVHLKRA